MNISIIYVTTLIVCLFGLGGLIYGIKDLIKMKKDQKSIKNPKYIKVPISKEDFDNMKKMNQETEKLNQEMHNSVEKMNIYNKVYREKHSKMCSKYNLDDQYEYYRYYVDTTK